MLHKNDKILISVNVKRLWPARMWAEESSDPVHNHFDGKGCLGRGEPLVPSRSSLAGDCLGLWCCCAVCTCMVCQQEMVCRDPETKINNIVNHRCL